MSCYSIGVDGGGSKTHAVLVKDNKIIAEAYAGPSNIRTQVTLAYIAISQVIDELLNKHNLVEQEIPIGIGVAGFSALNKRQELEQLLAIKYSNFKLASDCHIAYLAAHDRQDGAIIICGTGVVAYFMQNKQAKQLGGWGFPQGDLGGGAWLGLEACKLVCKAIDGVVNWSPFLQAIFAKFNHNGQEFKEWLIKAKPHDFTQITSLLLDYLNIDIQAKHIMQQGLNEISMFTQAVKKQTLNLPVVLMGGLAKFYFPKLSASFPGLKLTTICPALGASYLLN